MRQNIDLPILQTIVHLICDTNDKFSAYDVTQLVRKKLPSHEVNHDDVKQMVADYAKQNNLLATNNGTFTTYTKCMIQVSQSPSTNVKKVDSRQNQLVNAITANPTPVVNSSVKPSVQSRQDQIVNAVQSVGLKALKKSTQAILPVKSEGRIVLLPEIKQFKNAHIRRDNGRIVIMDKPHKGFEPLNTKTDRIRTGFKALNAKVVVHSDWAEITPS